MARECLATAVTAATAELLEAHEILDAHGVPRATAMGTPYSLPDRVTLALAQGRKAREAMADVAAISAKLAALVKRHGSRP